METDRTRRQLLIDLAIMLCGVLLFLVTGNMLFLLFPWLMVAVGFLLLETGKFVMRVVVIGTFIATYMVHLLWIGSLNWALLSGRFLVVGVGAAAVVAVAAYDRERVARDAQFYRDEFRRTRALLTATQDMLHIQRDAHASAESGQTHEYAIRLSALVLLETVLLQQVQRDRSARSRDRRRGPGPVEMVTAVRAAALLLHKSLGGIEIANSCDGVYQRKNKDTRVV